MNVEKIKGLVADEKLRIRLHDEIAKMTKDVISSTNEDKFPLDKVWSPEEFKRRIKEYEDISSDLCSAQIMISYWGNRLHKQTIVLPFRMIADYWLEKTGRSIWYILPWYNNLLFFYYTGTATIASGLYENLKAVTERVISDPKRPDRKSTLLQAILSVSNSYQDHFQLISGDAKHYVPRSEYLFKQLKPKFEGHLYLGSDYEYYFDRFEIMMALEYAHQTARDSPEYISAPIGCFGYKKWGYNPLAELIEEATDMGDDWSPLKAGLFGGSYSRFERISTLLEERVKNLHW